MRGSRGAYRVLVGHPEGRRQVERHCRTWYNIKMYIKEIGWKGVGWILLAQDRGRGWVFMNVVIK
jgi:hypothetical protein